jgi:two-component system invasion response regulator UvrY
MIRVLIADAETLVRDGLKFIFEEASDICVVAEASNGDEAVAEYKRCQPDVAVLDVAMPWGEGLDTIEQLVSLDPRARILVLTGCEARTFAKRALKAGALGYMTKSSSASELLYTVRAIGDRHTPSSRQAGCAAARHLPVNSTCENLAEDLSNRELQVLWLMARGHRMSEIASALGLSGKTVSTYRKRTFRKLDIRSDTEAYWFARQNGLGLSRDR